jgi:hypothetical protein
MAQLKTEYSSVTRFVVQERLHWGDGSNLAPKGRPFEFNGNNAMPIGSPRTHQPEPHS